jgi:Amt family ammonium transporter
MSFNSTIGTFSTSLLDICEVDRSDTVWMTICSVLVMLMIPSVGFIYAGLVNQGSISSILGLCLAILSMTTVQWCLMGYSLVFGNSFSGIIGDLKYLGMAGLTNFNNKCHNTFSTQVCLEHKYYWDSCGIPEALFFFFQSKFAGITSVLVIGSFSERMYFKYSLLYVFFWNLLIYCPIGHWVWNAEGFFHLWGVRDYAGGIVVHISAGYSSLVASLMLGKRKNFGTMPEVSNFVFYIFGTLLLWFGWFGFNGGSNYTVDGIAIFAIINTNISAAISLIVWIVVDLLVYKKISAAGLSLGVISGLVAITPSAGYIPLSIAFLYGVTAGGVCWTFIHFKRKYQLFDDLEVFACHGISGTLGALLCGLFASKDINPHLPYDGLAFVKEGESKMFIVMQIVATLAIAAYSSLMTFIILAIIKKCFKYRAKSEEEIYYDHINFFDQISMTSKKETKIEVIR